MGKSFLWYSELPKAAIDNFESYGRGEPYSHSPYHDLVKRYSKGILHDKKVSTEPEKKVDLIE